MSEARELFPVTFLGPKNQVSTVGESLNPDGSKAGALAGVPEPTPAQLAAIEAGEAVEVVPAPPVDVDSAGKEMGAAGKP